MEPPIHWVAALQCEARPLIELLGLRFCNAWSRGGFSVYADEKANHRLIVSGVGKVAVAAAVSWLEAAFRKGNRQGNVSGIWLNAGVGGHRSASLGSVFRAAKITDRATEKSWYPAAVWPRQDDAFSLAEVVTVDRAVPDYPPENQVVDMEAAGFYPSAARFSTVELVQVVKVISDNEETGIDALDAELAEKLMREAAPSFIEWCEVLRGIAYEEAERNAFPPGWEEVLARHRFSETRKHRFKRLARWALVRGKFDSLPDWIEQNEFRNAKEILAALESLLLPDTEGTEN